jgi:antagonist of KipI
MNVFEVQEPGLLTTVQDAGRYGHEADGVPRSGAADGLGLAVANLLLGNPPDAAAIECTILGPTLRVLADVEIGLAGADLGAHVAGGGRRLAVGETHRLAAGEVLAFGGPVEDEPAGCRAYLALPGSVGVPEVLGSRSTCLPAGFGGHHGRPFVAGDRIEAAASARPASRSAARRVPAALAAELPSPAQRIRILPGPASGDRDPARAGLLERPWVVAMDSDRRGLRLEPADPGADSSALAPLAAGELPSLGVLPGAIQVTPSGQPVVLMPDSGTTGGYPVIAVVVHADLPLLGQLAPGAEVRFREATLEQALAAERERRAWLARLALSLEDSLSSR